jgi:hypothetical protein
VAITSACGNAAGRVGRRARWISRHPFEILSVLLFAVLVLDELNFVPRERLEPLPFRFESDEAFRFARRLRDSGIRPVRIEAMTGEVFVPAPRRREALEVLRRQPWMGEGLRQRPDDPPTAWRLRRRRPAPEAAFAPGAEPAGAQTEWKMPAPGAGGGAGPEAVYLTERGAAAAWR